MKEDFIYKNIPKEKRERKTLISKIFIWELSDFYNSGIEKK